MTRTIQNLTLLSSKLLPRPVGRLSLGLSHIRHSTSTSSGPGVPAASGPLPTSGTPEKPPADKMVHIRNISAQSSEVQVFRRVMWTGRSSQLVLMNIPAGGDIGEEVSLSFDADGVTGLKPADTPRRPTSVLHGGDSKSRSRRGGEKY
jgi:hypothetical protein